MSHGERVALWGSLLLLSVLGLIARARTAEDVIFYLTSAGVTCWIAVIELRRYVAARRVTRIHQEKP